MSRIVDLSSSAMVAQVQANFIAYFRLFASLDGIIFKEDDVTWFVNTHAEPGNYILRTQVHDKFAEQRIDAVLAEIGQYSDSADWLVFPTDRPANLGARLEARGIRGHRAGIWMVADLTTMGDPPPVPDAFHIERVRDETMLDEWISISTAGYGEDLSVYHQAYAQNSLGPDAFSLHYIGYLGDNPVTSATLLDAGGCASIYNVSTPASLRRRGFGSAITYALMQEIRRRGYSDTWLWSSEMGKSVYEELGYYEVDFGIREHTWYRRESSLSLIG